MGEELVAAKRTGTRSQAVMLVLGLTGCLLAIGTPFKAVLLYITIGLILVVISLITIARVSTAKDLLSVGTVTVQGTWVNMSCGLAWLLMPHAPYFEISTMNWGIAIVLGLITTLFGVYVLLQMKAKTGVVLSA